MADDFTGRTQKSGQIMIIGCGTGNRRFLTKQAMAALNLADLCVGSEEMLRRMEDILKGRATEPVRNIPAIRRLAECGAYARIAVLVEGDPGTDRYENDYSELLDLRPAIIPGVSAASYMASRTGIPLRDAVTVDLRRKRSSLLPHIEKNARVLAYGSEKMKSYFREILAAGYKNIAVYALSCPGGEGESVFRGTIEEAAARDFPADSMFLFMRPGRLPGRVEEIPFGPEDSVFPAEVRAAALTRLSPGRADVIYCIGSGYGDVACEAALAVPSGIVYAVEENRGRLEEAVKNAARHGIRNMVLIRGSSPEALSHLPAPDGAVLLCEGKRFTDTIQILVSRNPFVRIAVLTRDMAFAVKASDALETAGFDTDVTEIRVSRRRKTGGRQCLRAENPVFIVSGTSRGGVDHG